MFCQVFLVFLKRLLILLIEWLLFSGVVKLQRKGDNTKELNANQDKLYRFFICILWYYIFFIKSTNLLMLPKSKLCHKKQRRTQKNDLEIFWKCCCPKIIYHLEPFVNLLYRVQNNDWPVLAPCLHSNFPSSHWCSLMFNSGSAREDRFVRPFRTSWFSLVCLEPARTRKHELFPQLSQCMGGPF